MSDMENGTFKVQQLRDFPHYFSEEEHAALEKWGAQAEGLTNGATLSMTAREAKFVEVAGGKSAPVTRFQSLWLRYRQAVLIQEKLRSSEQSLTTVTRKLDSANSRIEQLQEDVIRLTKLWEFARDSVGTPKMDPLNSQNSLNQPSSPHQSCGTTQVQALSETCKPIFVRDVTSRDQYLQFTEKGLASLSDNEIFVLFHFVDALALTPQEVEDFNIEYRRRAGKYQSTDSVSVTDWDWRDQNEAK